MTERTYRYIHDTFNISTGHLATLASVWDYLEDRCHSLETSETKGILVPCFWHDFLMICDAGSIDLTEKELIEHADGAVEKRDYYCR